MDSANMDSAKKKAIEARRLLREALKEAKRDPHYLLDDPWSPEVDAKTRRRAKEVSDLVDVLENALDYLRL